MLISAIIKARNEEQNIPDCIASLRGFADEIIVVDDASTDATVRIATECGAHVVPGVDHGGLINELDRQGFVLARGAYILRLDADERLTPGLATLLKEVAATGQYAGVKYARLYWFFGGWLFHGGWFRSEQLGFFRADAWDRTWNCDIHSQVPVVGEVLRLEADPDSCMLHLDYDSVTEFVNRSLRDYARLEAHERLRDGYHFSPLRLMKAVARRSLGRYLLRAGYKDGGRGAVVAGLLGAYEVCVAAYAWEMRRNPNAVDT